MLKQIVLSLSLVLATAVAASASPITYVHTGFGSGTLGGVAFGAAAPVAFTINATGDTANIVSCAVGCLSNDNLSASITITGVGTLSFITATRYFSTGGIAGFSRAGIFGSDLFYSPPIGPWDMATSIGPIAGTGSLLQWALFPVNTSGGILVFNNGFPASTFTATVEAAAVPEPASFLLLGTGIAAFALRRRFAKGGR